MMDDDKFIRDILANGIETPSDNFTKSVMGKIAKEKLRSELPDEVPSFLFWMAAIFPVLAILVSMKPIYAVINTFLGAFGLADVLTQGSLLVIIGGLLALCLLDVALRKIFVHRPIA